MNDILQMSLLGPVVISKAQQEITGFRSRKALALLIYLACTEQSQGREALADLLWGDCRQQQALSNLRTTLVHLRDRVGDCLHSTPGHLALNPRFPCWVDAVDVQRQLTALLPDRSALLTQPTARQLEKALQLYRGDFLAGFHVQHAPYFEEWVLIEGERLRRMVIEGYQRLVAFYVAQGDHKAGLRGVDRWLALDRLDEEGHTQRIHLLAADGQRAAALAQYETCRRVLKEELGVEPAEQTTRLQERIRAGQWAHHGASAVRLTAAPQTEPPAAPARRFDNLPTALTLFVGRNAEMAHIADCLADPGCRLLTITGLRGMGKTALALQAAASAAHFADGVCYLPIVDALEPGDLARLIADTLKLPISSSDHLQEEVCAHLRQKHLLLLLDNLEHLGADAGFVTTVLQQTRALKVLGTSLEPLKQRAEWLVPLHGLSRADSAPASQLDLTGLDDLLGCDHRSPDSPPEPLDTAADALRLFVIRARQAQPRFRPAVTDLPAIMQICRLVDGMPLAIEMAAELIGSLSCSEIAEELEHNPLILASSRHDVPVRQQSLEHIFAQTWRHLSPGEIQVLQNVESVGNRISREVLQQITGATLPIVAALVQKSFLWRTSSGSYQMSELLRRYVSRGVTELCV
ncbi:MAG TPA: BTAD domain-containing putative transcriptional regulator [Herpetosiphonaceae bacterium]